MTTSLVPLKVRHAQTQARQFRRQRSPAKTEQRSALDNPALSLNDPETWLKYWGQSMTDKRALAFSPIYRCCDMLSNTIGKLPAVIYKRVNEGKEPDPTHPAYRLLKYQWNQYQTAITALGITIFHRLLYGNSYTWIMRDDLGRPQALVPLDPANNATYPVRVDGQIWYVTTLECGEDGKADKVVFLRHDEVIHMRSPLGNCLVGYNVLEVASTAFSSGLAAQQFTADFFANDASGGVIIQYPGALKEQAIKSLREGWDKAHKGGGKAHRTAILENGATIERMSINAEDAQLMDSIKWSAIDAANFFGCPPHKVGVTDRAAFNTLEEENRSLLTDTVDAHLVTFEQEARAKLLTEEEKRSDSHIIEFRREALLRADLATRTAAYATATGGRAWMSPDEVRTRENMNTVGGAQSEILDPTNNYGETEPGATDPDEEAGGDDNRNTQAPRIMIDDPKTVDPQLASAAQACLDHVKTRMVKRVTKGYARTGHVAESHQSVIEAELRHPAELVRLMTGEEDPAGRVMDEIIAELKELA